MNAICVGVSDKNGPQRADVNSILDSTVNAKEEEKGQTVEFKGPVINGKQCPSYAQYLEMTPAEKTSFFELLTSEERATFLRYCSKAEVEAELEKTSRELGDSIRDTAQRIVQRRAEEIIQREFEEQIRKMLQESEDHETKQNEIEVSTIES